ncbi:MAG TPA: hypothetical protein VGI82_05665 [Chitinophagaceae bacterium]
MRIPLLTGFCLSIFIAILIFSCQKKDNFDSTDYQTQRLTEMIMPLQKGKYITYRVDSTVFTSFGRNTEVHSYLIKHVADTTITDNLGRPSFRIFTYLSDTTGTQPWQPIGSYFITVLSDRVELIENNMRVIKIHVPVRDGTTWKGNMYMAEDPYGAIYNFSNDDDMADWDFSFDGGLQSSVSLQDTVYNNTYNYDNVYSITEANDVDPVTDPSDYGSVTISQEMYSKDIGLVYRELTMWEQQPNPSGNPPNVTYDPYRIGFGMRMWMVDHN